jgi:hypothetical protein
LTAGRDERSGVRLRANRHSADFDPATVDVRCGRLWALPLGLIMTRMMEDFGGGHLRPAPGPRFRWRSPRFARCAQQSDRGWCTAKSNLAVRAKANDVKDFLADVDATICVTRLWMRSSIRSMRFLCRELGVGLLWSGSGAVHRPRCGSFFIACLPAHTSLWRR